MGDERPELSLTSRPALALARAAGVASALTVALLLGPASGTAQTAASYKPMDGYARVTGVDVLHYDIGIRLPEEGGAIEGRTGILFEMRDDAVNELPLDFGELTVDSVAVNGAPASFKHEGLRLSVSLPPLASEARAEAVVWYHGAPQDGLFLQPNKHGAATVFADNWPDRARHWFPGIDHPSDKATVDFVVEAPARMEVIANGALRGIEDLGANRRRTSWSESEELPTYNMVIGAADFAVQRELVRGVEVADWIFPEDSTAGAVAFARGPEIVALFDSLIGPYPFEKLAYVQSSTRFGGMENSSAIFFDEKALGAKVAPATGSALASPTAPAAPAPGGAAADTSEGGASLAGEEQTTEDGTLTDLAAHETAHQWFGDAVTEADWHHLWLSEGFATYLASVFFELRGGPLGKGPEELERRMRASAETLFSNAEARSRPIVDPSETDLFALLNVNNYEKGAWVLHMLRHEIGDGAFFEGLRDYYAAFNGGTAWSEDLERMMERTGGRELGWFFQQWLDRPGWPVLQIDVEGAGKGKTRIRIEQVQPGPAYRFTLDLELTSAEGKRREKLDVSRRETVVILETPEPPRAVVADPDGWLLHQMQPATPPISPPR